MSRSRKAESPILPTIETAGRATDSDSIRLDELPPLPDSSASSNISARRDEAELNDCFYKIIDVALDGTGAETRLECYTRAKLANLDAQIPSQKENSIRVVLDGRGEGVDYSYGSQESYETCEDDTIWVPSETGRFIPESPALFDGLFYLPSLQRMLSADFDSASHWYRAEYLVMHHHDCINNRSRFKGGFLAGYEVSDVKFRVAQGEDGNIIMLCSAPNAVHRAFRVSSGENKQCANANWRWLKTLDSFLQNGMPFLQRGNSNSLLIPHVLILNNLSTLLTINATFLHNAIRNIKLADEARASGSVSHNGVGDIACRIDVLRRVENIAHSVGHAIEYVVATLKMTAAGSAPSERHLPFLLFTEGLQQECNFHRQHATRTRETQVELCSIFANRVNIKQANSVTQLTRLAAIFLPLSLAAGVLSMQTRFADLKLLLYDFVGVMLILGTVAAAFAFINRYGDSIYRSVVFWPIVMHAPYTGKATTLWYADLRLGFIGIWWLVLLISFLIGMVKDVILGLKVLGFEVAAVSGVWLFSLIGLRLWERFRRRLASRQRKKFMDSFRTSFE